jgi:uncharacterized OB-fold protein
MVITSGMKRFKKNCERCGKLYQPLGRYDRICKKCKKRNYHIRFLNKKIDKYFIKLNKVK